MHPVIVRVRELVRRTGFDVIHYPLPPRRVEAEYLAHMERLAVTLLIDGGANKGQFASKMRSAGWQGRIESFEPLPDEFGTLAARAVTDPNWSVHNVALGDVACTSTFHVAGNSVSSSLLPMLEAHVHAAPESAYTGTVSVEVMRLDDALAASAGSTDRICLKLDCQGSEREVLAGAPNTLERSVMLIVELSLVPLYEGGMLLGEALELLRENGFGLVAIEPVLRDPDCGALVAVDGCFVRFGAQPPARGGRSG